MRQRLGMALAQVQIARVRRDGEGLFVESEEAEVHGGPRLPTQPPDPARGPGNRLARVRMPDPKRSRMPSMAASNREPSAGLPLNKSACTDSCRSLTPTPNNRTAASGWVASQRMRSAFATAATTAVSWVGRPKERCRVYVVKSARRILTL